MGDSDHGFRAPGGLGVVQELSNSFDLRRGRDDLAGPAEAAGWLVEHELARSTPAVSEVDLAQLHELRSALRNLLLAHNGGAGRHQDLEVVNRAIQASGLRPRLTAVNAAELEIAGDGFLAAVGRILAIVVEAVHTGTWERLKACPGDACNYAFYDHSRNGSRVWCDMSRCGSRSKMRAHRTRTRAARSSARLPNGRRR